MNLELILIILIIESAICWFCCNGYLLLDNYINEEISIKKLKYICKKYF